MDRYYNQTNRNQLEPVAELEPVSEREAIAFMRDTSRLVSQHNVSQLSAAAAAARSSNALTNEVEFWKWMARNYRESGIFDSAASMQEYIAGGAGKEAWFAKQVQGKGYEWDWMTKQRADPRNLFKRYDAGDVANRAASDVTETNLLTGQTRDYQMKAYTGKTNPDLKNTPQDMTVVTNAEKAETVRQNGYEDVLEFQDTDTIKRSAERRMERVKSGKAQTSYTLRNVTGTMAKAGALGCVIGMGTEAIASFRAWKERALTDEEYVKEILKSGGEAGLTGAATAGIMIPISAAITAAGLSMPITYPIAFAVGAAVNKVIAPCFGRGEYRALLADARYYQNLNAAYADLADSMRIASEEYYNFVCQMARQQQTYRAMRERSREIQNRNMELNRELQNLLDSI